MPKFQCLNTSYKKLNWWCQENVAHISTLFQLWNRYWKYLLIAGLTVWSSICHILKTLAQGFRNNVDVVFYIFLLLWGSLSWFTSLQTQLLRFSSAHMVSQQQKNPAGEICKDSHGFRRVSELSLELTYFSEVSKQVQKGTEFQKLFPSHCEVPRKIIYITTVCCILRPQQASTLLFCEKLRPRWSFNCFLSLFAWFPKCFLLFSKVIQHCGFPLKEFSRKCLIAVIKNMKWYISSIKPLFYEGKFHCMVHSSYL